MDKQQTTTMSELRQLVESLDEEFPNDDGLASLYAEGVLSMNNGTTTYDSVEDFFATVRKEMR